MGSVEFDEQGGDSYQGNFGNDEKSSMVRFMEKLGIPSEYVNYVFIAIAVIFFAISIILVLRA